MTSATPSATSRLRRSLGRLRRRARRWAVTRQDGTPVTIVTPNGAQLTWLRDHRYPPGFVDGTYEPELLARLASLLDSGDGFLDLGANAGFVSFMVKTMVGSGRVIAVEPLPDNIAMIGRIQAINPDLPVELIEGAVGAERGDISLGVAANTANSRIDGAAWSLEKPLVDEVVVRSYPLDDLIDEARPAVVKIDIEGAEELVLAASLGPDGWGTRPALVIEYHGPVNRAYCVTRLEEWGYDVAVEPSIDQPEESGLVVAMTRSSGESA